MLFLANYWGVLLVVAVVLAVLAFVNQLQRMRRMFNGVTSLDVDESFNGFFKGMLPLVLLSLGASVAFLLAVVGIIARFNGYGA
jgi:ABC-type uncharacterized transport system permease subunit